MIQKQIFFINNFIIIASIIFIVIFFIPIFKINISLDYKINGNDLIVNMKNLNIKKDLFVKLDKNTMIISHHTGSFKINSYDVQRSQIVLDIRQFNVENGLKIFYSFKKNVISYILKNKKC
ncbi:hypothetical protein AGMMS5026_03530 [Endomicrobiia bacterium]|uniref:hypothetical protein n=1 Tax=Endomicrobium trichonymphae TaxID=1408204 RepID=UPI00086502CD|nr:hypothetical protein [Candidatus Endomicrobium trichonymphae]GHT05443.1 hypothetical protein AGMMS49523_04870 [Endomicrobiia bacterium]BAV59057.1 hypothetical protein RSTT_477 [Candidatus Endomicrobium trichonymphae]GHT08160.1 hypothetical protein AGMMS49532_02580 [Endomicrobiia bacterium]GHT13702.1 hypothetical protein AGMMS49571_07920 [Endomicrobiia bacterium]GHT19072.1 hypothetical protein AGMMS49929_01990 [Endomicrobiia bacterium]